MAEPLSQINIGNFTLTIPTGWEINTDEEVLAVIKSDNGVGTIQISSYYIDAHTPFDLFNEFHELVSETLAIPLEKSWANDIKLLRDNFLVFEAANPTDNRFFIIGFCEHNRSILFLTYNCSLDDKDLEYKDVHLFFKNITFNDIAST